MDDADEFQLMITDKHSHMSHLFEGPSYGYVLTKAYSYFLKELKERREEN
jgi:hypothetical protein